MSKNSASKQYIIPIQIEGSEFVQTNTEEPSIMSVSSASKERIIPIQIEGSEPVHTSIQEPAITESAVEEPEQDPEPTNNENDEIIVTPSILDNLDAFPEVIEETPPDRTLPIYNTKEKIILVLDRAQDDNYTPFKLSNSGTSSPLLMLKRSIEVFLKWKSSINKRHEFALVVLDENSASWCLDFTTNVEAVVNKLNEVTSCEAEDIFDLKSLFGTILRNVTLPTSKSLEIPPPYIIRTILLYSRSYTVPQLDSVEEIDNLLNSPYFTLDILMTHEPIGSDNNCNKIFQILQNLDKKGFSYFFPVSRNARCLYSSMGILLSHPMQRPFKKFAEYNIKDLQRLLFESLNLNFFDLYNSDTCFSRLLGPSSGCYYRNRCLHVSKYLFKINFASTIVNHELMANIWLPVAGRYFRQNNIIP